MRSTFLYSKFCRLLRYQLLTNILHLFFFYCCRFLKINLGELLKFRKTQSAQRESNLQPLYQNFRKWIEVAEVVQNCSYSIVDSTRFSISYFCNTTWGTDLLYKGSKYHRKGGGEGQIQNVSLGFQDQFMYCCVQNTNI